MLAGLVAACGGGGGGGTVVTDRPVTPPPAPPAALALTDSLPASGTAVDPSTRGFNVVHVGDADWRFEYAGACAPTGFALRRPLDDLSASDDGREIVDHKLDCALESGVDYEVRVDAAAGDGARHRAVLEFTSDTERAARGVAVLGSARLSRGAVDQLFRRYVRDAVLDEVDTPIVGTLAALIVAQIAGSDWTELGARGATYGTVSEAVAYASRSPSGAAATLSGLVAMPDIADDADYVPPGRVVVLAHATGSTPSGLSHRDGWYVLANLLAGRGYLVIAPDNWGRGETGGEDRPETYLMANRVAHNGLDMLREVLADARYDRFRGAGAPVDVAVIGYSQGAHSAIALWLANAAVEKEASIREVYAGGGPHDLYRTVRGTLERLRGSCDGNPWCRAVDADVMEPYATDRIMPAYLRYTDVGLTLDDILDGERLSKAFIDGMLDGGERFDALKTMLQLNSFANLIDLATTMPAVNTRVRLYHSPLDRLVPQQNTRDLADALAVGFDLTAHLDSCGSNAFEELGGLVKVAGLVHVVCAFEMFDRALRDLREDEAARGGYSRDAGVRLDPALPWLQLAERYAHAAESDVVALVAFRAARSESELRRLSMRLYSSSSPQIRLLAERLAGKSHQGPR